MKKLLVVLVILALLGGGGYYYYINYYEKPAEVTATPVVTVCEHEWAPATCMVAETCLKCGQVQGEPIAHVWGDTSCVSPQPCLMCGTMDGLVVEHQWQENAHICEACGVDMRTMDERFAASLSEGLTNRWELTKAYMARLEAQAYAEAHRTATQKKRVLRYYPQDEMLKYLQAEHDAIISYQNALFENEEYGDWAYRYISGLLLSIDEMNETYDTTHFVDQYTRAGFHEQSLALYKLNQMIPLNIPEEYTEDFNVLLENGELIDQMNLLMELTAFQNIQTLTDGRDRFEAIVKNTTGRKFETFSYEINLLDASGEVVETRIMDTEDWEPGAVERFNFIAPLGVEQVKIVGADWMFEEEE